VLSKCFYCLSPVCLLSSSSFVSWCSYFWVLFGEGQQVQLHCILFALWGFTIFSLVCYLQIVWSLTITLLLFFTSKQGFCDCLDGRGFHHDCAIIWCKHDLMPINLTNKKNCIKSTNQGILQTHRGPLQTQIACTKLILFQLFFWRPFSQIVYLFLSFLPFMPFLFCSLFLSCCFIVIKAHPFLLHHKLVQIQEIIVSCCHDCFICITKKTCHLLVDSFTAVPGKACMLVCKLSLDSNSELDRYKAVTTMGSIFCWINDLSCNLRWFLLSAFLLFHMAAIVCFSISNML